MTRSGAIRLLLLAALALPASVRAEHFGCDVADERVRVVENSTLDPACTYTRGVLITDSNVELDCQGAHIVGDRQRGIEISSPVDVPLSNVTVRNCYVEGFLNNVRVTRDGFRDLPQEIEYDATFSNIVLDNITSKNSRGVGIFVDGFVADVTIRNSHVEGAGSAGIYLETGSINGVVENNVIINNGYTENGPNGQFFETLGTPVWFWGTGREGLSIDGSRFNVIRGNTFSGNSYGGILMYKNCGEFFMTRPERWFDRRYGSEGNLIEDNTFIGEDNGVWLAARMSENIAPMQCSDPQYLPGYAIDYGHDNIVRNNTFENVTLGIRVEDDDNTVTGNVFTGDQPWQEAIVIGTQQRTTALGEPVTGTVVTGNSADIAGNTNPYRWIWGHENTTFDANTSHGREVGLCEGEQPPRALLVMAVALDFEATPENPPSGPPVTLPLPNVLPPCPLACAAGAPVTKSQLTVSRIATPPGDERVTLRGEVVVPTPLTPTLDPIAVGVGIRVEDADGTTVLDVLVPGGAYSAVTRSGWSASGRNTWKYRNKSDDAPAGITSVTVKDLSSKQPGLLKISVEGKGGTYPVAAATLPLRALLVLDPPTAETGQCGVTSFAPAGCRNDGRTVRCR